MPLYEYECQQCHKHTEKRQKFSDPEITECPFCGGKLQRVLSAPAFSFAGGGWYKDLYSSNKPASKDGGDSAGSKSDIGKSDSGKSDGGKTESKSSDSSSATPASTPAAAPAAPSAPAASSSDKK